MLDQPAASEQTRHGYAPPPPKQRPVDDRPSVTESFHGLVEEGKAAARAEIDLLKTTASVSAGAGARSATWFAVAGVLALVALIALAVGAIIAIATALGPVIATLIVVGILLVGAAIAAVIGRGHAQAVSAAISEFTR